MNCANHSEQAAVAFCRTCGKPLCNQCTRDVRGVIYCESCLAARMEGTQPAPGYVPPQPGFAPVPPAPGVVPPQTGYQQFMDQGLGLKVAPGPATGPNPAVAGILAGFFPIGVGAVYTGQYTKGLVYLGITVLTIIAQAQDIPGLAHAALGIFMAFFWVYQIIDAAKSAKAIQMGEPVPDPMGLASVFGSGGTAASPAGEKAEGTKIPLAAAVLIGLGVLFLINTAFDFSLHRYWPLILIALGVWAFAKQWGLLGGFRPACLCDRCKTRRLMFPAIVTTLGVLFLLNELSTIDFGKTWPAILLVIGVVKLVQSNASYNGHVGPLLPGAPAYPPGTPPPPGMPGTYQNPAPSTTGAPDANASSSSEVKNV
jgi:hypothetical protein